MRPSSALNKSLLVAALCTLASLVSSSALAADLAGPLWEVSPAAIQRQMAADPAVATVRDSANHLSYRGGSLFGQPVQSWRYASPSVHQPPQLAVHFAATASATAYKDLHRLLAQAYGRPDEFQDAARRDALWTPGPSATFPGFTTNVLLTAIASGRDQRIELTFYDAPTPPGTPGSTLRYSLQHDPHPTPGQLDDYQRITDAMDRAVRFYERYTVGITKTDTVFLDPTEATAEGNINGNIQFGPRDISLRTALHEISHTVGIGTTTQYHRLTVNGQFIGKHALAQLRAITGDDHAILHADTWHFWPYGLNNPGEDLSIWDYVYHCQMVSAILQDLREFR